MTTTCNKAEIFLSVTISLLCLFAIIGCVSVADQPVIFPAPLLTPTVITLPTATLITTAKCKYPFKEISDIIKASPQIDSSVIVSKILPNSEDFLNSCLDPNLSLSAQLDNLKEFGQASQINYN